MTQTLTIGYSPCPNDTFIFYALVHGKVRVPGVEFRERLEDVETLNRLALDGGLDITKISYHALGHLREQYALLRSGGALGRGCGPLIVARPGVSLADLKKGVIAIPGRLTTAYLLLRLFDPSLTNVSVMPFDRIMDAVHGGSDCRPHHPRKPLHLSAVQARKAARPRRVVGEAFRASDPPGRHPRETLARQRNAAQGGNGDPGEPPLRQFAPR